MTPSVIAAVPWAELALFLWVLANQGGVPIPVVPALLGAGALAGSGGSLSGVVTLAVSIAAALCADLTWYLLGRWRGSRALDLLARLVPKARTHVQCASHLRFAHGQLFQLIARFLPELNPIAAAEALHALQRLTVQRRAVARAQVFDVHLAVTPEHACVHLRHEGVVEHDGAASAASDRELVVHGEGLAAPSRRLDDLDRDGPAGIPREEVLRRIRSRIP